MVEHFIGNEEVECPIPSSSTISRVTMVKPFDPIFNTIHVDLDGVLVNLNDYILECTGGSIDPQAETFDWNVLAKIPGLYLNPKPYQYYKSFWQHILKCGHQVAILTAIPRRSTMPEAEGDKREWVTKWLGPDVKVAIGPHAHDKWKHAKPGDILIDDKISNIEEWIKKGHGHGILHDPAHPADTLAALDHLVNWK